MMRVLRANKGRASVPGVSEELYAEDEAPHRIQKDERSLIGSLMWLARTTRPDGYQSWLDVLKMRPKIDG